jgi:hypothetical protein
MARASRAMVLATKRAMTNSNNMGNGYGKEGGERVTVATMAIRMGMAIRTWPLVLQLERGG